MPSRVESEHEFGALNTLLLVVTLCMCVLAAYFIKHNSFYYLPESAAAILVGIVAGGMAKLLYPSKEELDFLTLQPEVFFFLFLPPIIFEAGYSLEKTSFFSNFWSISLFAVMGTIISTIVIGYLVFWIGQTGTVTIDTNSPIEALLFGALLSAIDPVATLSIMGNPDLRISPLLYSLVFGESVLNDAVAVVVFKTLFKYVERPHHQTFAGQDMLLMLGEFFGICFGSLIVAILFGLICSFVCKHTFLSKYPEYEIGLIFLTAYGCYSFAESVEASGILSIFFCGIILSHYNERNLSSQSQLTLHYVLKTLAAMCEFIVYLYVGMGIFTGRVKDYHFIFFLWTSLFCVIGRFLNIFPLSLLANRGRRQQISINMQLMQWFSGLRGAIAFVLAMQIPAKNHGDVYLSTTLLIVVFTTVVCGGLTEPLLTRLGMRMPLEETTIHGVDPKYESVNIDDSTSSSDCLTSNPMSSDSPKSSASSTDDGYPIDATSRSDLSAHSPLPPLVAPELLTDAPAHGTTRTFTDMFIKFDREVLMPIFGTIEPQTAAPSSPGHGAPSHHIEPTEVELVAAGRPRGYSVT